MGEMLTSTEVFCVHFSLHSGQEGKFWLVPTSLCSITTYLQDNLNLDGNVVPSSTIIVGYHFQKSETLVSFSLSFACLNHVILEQQIVHPQ